MRVHQILSEVGVEPVPGQIGKWRVVYPDAMNKVPDILGNRNAAQQRYDSEVSKFNQGKAQSYLDKKDAERQAAQQPEKQPKAEKKPKVDKKTAEGKFRKWFKQSGNMPKKSFWKTLKFGGVIGGILNLLEVWPDTAEYIATYIINDRDPTHPEVKRKQQQWEDSVTAAIVGVGSATGAGGLTALWSFLRVPMLAIPGIGWLGYAASSVVMYVLAKLITDTEWVYDNIVKGIVRPYFVKYALRPLTHLYITNFYNDDPDTATIMGLPIKQVQHENFEQNIVETKPSAKENIAKIKDIFKDAPPEIKAGTKKAVMKAKSAKQAAS